MKDWLPRILILVALAIVLGVPLLFKPARASNDVEGDTPHRLIIYSPHNEQIRYEFSRGYNANREKRGEPRVHFDWRAAGGTTDIRKKIIAEFEAKAAEGLEDEGIGSDLFFGGGDYEHNKIAKGITVSRGGEDVHVDITEKIELPDGMLETVFPRATIGGEQLYHPKLSWVGAALSSFGVVYNRDVLDMLGVPEPTTWADLQDPRLRKWVALADPGHSGSIAATYNTIVRRLGWTEGWGVLRRIYANSRYFTASSSKVPVDVSAGEAAAGMCIDFYGRYQAGAIGGNRVGYVDPPRMTAITADPVTILRGAPHKALANDFVIWLLSREGQRLWQARVGTPGGVDRFEIRRLPARVDIYTEEQMQHWADQVNPFAIAKPMPHGMPDFYGTIKTVSHAIAIDIHDDLVAAWTAINDHPDHPRRSEMLEAFDRMPPELTLTWPDAEFRANWQTYLDDRDHPRHDETAQVLSDFLGSIMSRWQTGDQELRDRLTWTMFFKDQYAKVVAIANE